MSTLLGRPPIAVLGRGECQRVMLDLKGVSRRQVASSIALQLSHLTGLSKPGFAWRQVAEAAEVWYWDEASPRFPSRVRPSPEMLLRPVLADGLHLLRCRSGFEAASVLAGNLVRTRWFATSPDANTWASFVQDAGADPAVHPLPSVEAPQLGQRLASGWHIHTHSTESISAQNWGWIALVMIVGMAFWALLAFQLKLTQRLDDLRRDRAALLAQSSVALTLQRQIDAQRAQLDVVAKVLPKVRQLELMAGLVEGDIFAPESKVTLQEWEYRNGRIRLQFSVPAESFSLSDFLESLEALGLFRDLRLLSGTPPQTVAIQAALVAEPTPQSLIGSAP